MSTTPAVHRTLRIYDWSCQPLWVAAALASTVEEARALLVPADHFGLAGDGSCSVRDQAREFIRLTCPLQFPGPFGVFQLTDNGNMEEMEKAMRTLRAQNILLETALTDISIRGIYGEGEDELRFTASALREIARAALARYYREPRL